jgi:hypothetical protein
LEFIEPFFRKMAHIGIERVIREVYFYVSKVFVQKLQLRDAFCDGEKIAVGLRRFFELFGNCKHGRILERRFKGLELFFYV